jgi:hypothetical protein
MADESATIATLAGVSSPHGERLFAALAAADGFALGRSLRSRRSRAITTG